MTQSEAVEARIGELFPDNGEKVREALDSFGADIGDDRRQQVLLAVLALSGGKLDELNRLLKVAARDFREVLIMLAEREEKD